MKKLFALFFAILTTLTSCKMFSAPTNKTVDTTQTTGNDFESRGFDDPFAEDQEYIAPETPSPKDTPKKDDEPTTPTPKDNPVTYYEITYTDDTGKKILYQTYVKAGEMPSFNANAPAPTKTSTVSYKWYSFSGWSPTEYPANKNQVYKATFVEGDHEFLIRFINGTTILSSTYYKYGQTVTKPSKNPTKASTQEFSYSFSGWNADPNGTEGSTYIPQVTSDRDYYAMYNAITRTYKVTFNNDDGTELYFGYFEYNTTPVYPNPTPVKASSIDKQYTFNGWNPAIAKVTMDRVFTATYKAETRKYKITYIDDISGAEIGHEYVDYGTKPNPAPPTRAPDEKFSYTFSKWEPAIANVTGDATYRAKFNTQGRQYKVTFMASDLKTPIQEYIKDYGVTIPTIEIPADAPKAKDAVAEYQHIGWNTAKYSTTPLTTLKVTQDTIYYPVYRILLNNDVKNSFEPIYTNYVANLYVENDIVFSKFGYLRNYFSWSILSTSPLGMIKSYDNGRFKFNQVGNAKVKLTYESYSVECEVKVVYVELRGNNEYKVGQERYAKLLDDNDCLIRLEQLYLRNVFHFAAFDGFGNGYKLTSEEPYFRETMSKERFESGFVGTKDFVIVKHLCPSDVYHPVYYYEKELYYSAGHVGYIRAPYFYGKFDDTYWNHRMNNRNEFGLTWKGAQRYTCLWSFTYVDNPYNVVYAKLTLGYNKEYEEEPKK